MIHHELVHAIINDMFYGGSIQSIIQNNIQLQIPLWFNEGLAEYEALGWDTQSDMYVRDAIVNDYLDPIPYLNGYFAYRGGQGVWDYVSEQYGKEKIGEIMQRLRLTRAVDASFQRATGLTLTELSERWHKALKRVHWPEGAAREELGEFAKPIVTRERGGYYNTSALGAPLSEICFEGPLDRLNRTDVAQPALYVCGVASFRGMTQRDGDCPIAAAAGLSLGEYTALHLAGAFDFAEGLRLVAQRGLLMQEAAEQADSSMVALIGADEDQAQAVCDEAAAARIP